MGNTKFSAQRRSEWPQRISLMCCDLQGDTFIIKEENAVLAATAHIYPSVLTVLVG